MTKAPQGKLVTKKHLARVERERMQTRMILIGSAIALVLVVLLIGYGVVDQTLIQPNRAVAKVNGEAINLREFQASVRYNRFQVIQYYNYLASIFGDNSDYLSQYTNQVQTELAASGQQTIDALVDDRLIRQEAQRRGITVTKEEVELVMQESMSYFPNGTATPKPTLEPLPTSTLSEFQMTAVAPTATSIPTPTAVPTTTAAITATAGVTETTPITETAATPSITETASITPTAVPTPLPTATPYTQSLYDENLNQLIANYKSIGVSESQLRRIIESSLYRQKVQEAVLAEMEISRTEEQVWARHIIINTPVSDTLAITGTVPATATLPISITQVLTELQNGADFAELAAKYSQDPSNAANGGDLGWFGKGKMDPAFEEAAWKLEVGQITMIPIKTSFGYHIIQVLGHEQRPLSDSEYEQLQQTKFQEWMTQKRAEAKIETYAEVWVKNTPDTPALNLSQP